MVWTYEQDKARHGWVWAVGNFDGVHAGHRALLQACAAEAAARGCPWGVLTFHPHPRTVLGLRSGEVFHSLMTWEEKVAALKAQGGTRVAVVPFNKEVSTWTAEDFIRRILVDWLGAAAVVVGENFRFGAKAAGHVDTLAADGRFAVRMVPLVRDEGGVISSTRLRAES